MNVTKCSRKELSGACALYKNLDECRECKRNYEKDVLDEEQYQGCTFDEAYQQGRQDTFKELAPLFEDIVTMDNICEAFDGEWCEKNCGNTDKCLAKYVEWLKENNAQE